MMIQVYILLSHVHCFVVFICQLYLILHSDWSISASYSHTLFQKLKTPSWWRGPCLCLFVKMIPKKTIFVAQDEERSLLSTSLRTSSLLWDTCCCWHRPYTYSSQCYTSCTLYQHQGAWLIHSTPQCLATCLINGRSSTALWEIRGYEVRQRCARWSPFILFISPGDGQPDWEVKKGPIYWFCYGGRGKFVRPIGG